MPRVVCVDAALVRNAGFPQSNFFQKRRSMVPYARVCASGLAPPRARAQAEVLVLGCWQRQRQPSDDAYYRRVP